MRIVMKKDIEKSAIPLRQALFLAGLILTLLGLSRPSEAQDTLGGHAGFVIPWVTHANGDTTTIADNSAVGFPIGVTVKGAGRLSFDFEMVPTIGFDPRAVTLTVDPGIIYSAGHGVSLGLRTAFDVNSTQFGFIPLINKSWPFKNKTGFFKSYFVEADLPVKFSRPTGQPASNPVTFATHFGLGF